MNKAFMSVLFFLYVNITVAGEENTPTYISVGGNAMAAFCQSFLDPMYGNKKVPTKVDKPAIGLADKVDKKQFATDMLFSILPAWLVGLGVTAAWLFSNLPSANGESITIDNTADFNKIGKDKNHPLDGDYSLTVNIEDGYKINPVGNRTNPFTGTFDGNEHNINGLNKCLFSNLKGGAEDPKDPQVAHLGLTNARIKSTGDGESVGALACQSEGKVCLGEIHVSDCELRTTGEKACAAAGVGYSTGSVKVTCSSFRNNTIVTKGGVAAASGGVGRVEEDINMSSSEFINNKLTTHGYRSWAGPIFGYTKKDAAVENVTSTGNEVTTYGVYSPCGGVGGELHGALRLKYSKSSCNEITAYGNYFSNAGPVVGRVTGLDATFESIDSTVCNNTVNAYGNFSTATQQASNATCNNTLCYPSASTASTDTLTSTTLPTAAHHEATNNTSAHITGSTPIINESKGLTGLIASVTVGSVLGLAGIYFISKTAHNYFWNKMTFKNSVKNTLTCCCSRSTDTANMQFSAINSDIEDVNTDIFERSVTSKD